MVPNVIPCSLVLIPANKVSEKTIIPKTIPKTNGYGINNPTMLLANTNKSKAMQEDFKRPRGCTSVSPNAIATTPNARVVAIKELSNNVSARINKKAMETVTLSAQRWGGCFQNTSIQIFFTVSLIKLR